MKKRTACNTEEPKMATAWWPLSQKTHFALEAHIFLKAIIYLNLYLFYRTNCHLSSQNNEYLIISIPFWDTHTKVCLLYTERECFCLYYENQFYKIVNAQEYLKWPHRITFSGILWILLAVFLFQFKVLGSFGRKPLIYSWCVQTYFLHIYNRCFVRNQRFVPCCDTCEISHI